MVDGQHPIVRAMEIAATGDFVREGGACKHCGSQNLNCTNRQILLTDMFEDYRCLDCEKMTFHRIEDY